MIYRYDTLCVLDWTSPPGSARPTWCCPSPQSHFHDHAHGHGKPLLRILLNISTISYQYRLKLSCFLEAWYQTLQVWKLCHNTPQLPKQEKFDFWKNWKYRWEFAKPRSLSTLYMLNDDFVFNKKFGFGQYRKFGNFCKASLIK